MLEACCTVSTRFCLFVLPPLFGFQISNCFGNRDDQFLVFQQCCFTVITEVCDTFEFLPWRSILVILTLLKWKYFDIVNCNYPVSCVTQRWPIKAFHCSVEMIIDEQYSTRSKNTHQYNKNKLGFALVFSSVKIANSPGQSWYPDNHFDIKLKESVPSHSHALHPLLNKLIPHTKCRFVSSQQKMTFH